MKAKGNGLIAKRLTRASTWAASSLAVLVALSAPAWAQRGGGGGHGGGGGGGHVAMGGGGHMGGFGGGHASFGGHAAFGGGGRMGGFGGAHFGAPPSFGGAHFGAPAGFAGRPTISARGFAATPHYVPRVGYAGHVVAGATVYHGVRPAFSRPYIAGRPAYAYGYGWGRGGWGWHRPYWGGGYWRGGYWPRAYYWNGCPWFLGVLPGVYATYWWGGIPYYYANDVYYTWNSGYNGYVVTDPPPTQESGTPDGNYESTSPADSSAANSGGAEVYAYPKDAQSEEQQATDRYECHKWAVAQSGFDPTQASRGGNTADYRRAMTACLDGRGYSTR